MQAFGERVVMLAWPTGQHTDSRQSHGVATVASLPRRRHCRCCFYTIFRWEAAMATIQLLARWEKWRIIEYIYRLDLFINHYFCALRGQDPSDWITIEKL
jgi:hypothetical protein